MVKDLLCKGRNLETEKFECLFDHWSTVWTVLTVVVSLCKCFWNIPVLLLLSKGKFVSEVRERGVREREVRGEISRGEEVS